MNMYLIQGSLLDEGHHTDFDCFVAAETAPQAASIYAAKLVEDRNDEVATFEVLEVPSALAAGASKWPMPVLRWDVEEGLPI